MRPVPAAFNCAYSRNGNANLSGDFAKANAVFDKELDCGNTGFIEKRSTIVCSFMRTMFNSISVVFSWHPVLKVVNTIVVPVAVKMPNYMAFWPSAYKMQSNSLMDVNRFLGFVLWAFFAINTKVVRVFVQFSQKPFSVFESGKIAKVADFVNSFIPFYGKPLLRSSHG